MSSAGVRRALVISAWSGVVAGWILYQRSTGQGAVGALEQFLDLIRGAWWGFPAFVGIYAVRPLVFFPASLLTIAGGLLFGPFAGVLATVVGANASAMLAYWLARSLGFERGEEGRSLATGWADRMRRESFVSVMLMRLLFLPFDLVNYLAGFLRIRPLPFLAATAIGSLPGTVSFTLAGASIQSLEQGPSGLDTRILLASLALFAASVLVARRLRDPDEAHEDEGGGGTLLPLPVRTRR